MQGSARAVALVIALTLAWSAAAPAFASIPAGKRIGAGAFHALALKEDGSVLAWGSNGVGAYGDGGTTSSPVPVVAFGGVAGNTSVWGTYAGTSVITSAGAMLSSGDNEWGTLGRTTPGNWVATPVQPAFPTMIPAATVVSVAAGYYHEAAVLSNGTLWAWGRNNYGQLGQTADGIAHYVPTQVGVDTDWRMAAAGRYHTMAIKSNGTLWAWGNNVDGQLGLGSTAATSTPTQVGTDTDWVNVVCGADHTLALKSNGTLWAWGRNNYGQLGVGHTTNPWLTRTQVVSPPSGTRWIAFTSGAFHGLGIRDDGSLWAWGLNNRGQLGDGTVGTSSSPVAVAASGPWRQVAAGEDWSMALAADEWVWTWGHNQVGQLGVTAIPTGTDSISMVPTKVVSLHVAPPAAAPTVAPVDTFKPAVAPVVEARRRFDVRGTKQRRDTVRLQLYLYSGGRWRHFKSIRTNTLLREGLYWYHFNLRVDLRGRWMLRARARTPQGRVVLSAPTSFSVR